MLAVFPLMYDVYYAWHYNAHFSLKEALRSLPQTAACVYICVKYLFTAHPAPERTERGERALAALTFGIYLFGDMVINYTERVYAALECRMHGLCAMALWEIFVFAAAALVTALLRCVPWVQKWL